MPEETTNTNPDPAVGGEIAAPVETTIPDADAQYEAQFEALLRGEEPKPFVEAGDQPADATVVDASKKDDGSTPALTELEKLAQEGLALKTAAEAKAAEDLAAASKKDEPKPGDTKTIEAAKPDPATVTAPDYSKLPKVVMIGDVPHNLPKAIESMKSSAIGQDPELGPILTWLIEDKLKTETPQLDASKPDDLQKIREEMKADRESTSKELSQLRTESFLSQIARMDCPEIWAIHDDAERKGDFWKDLNAAPEGVKLSWDQAAAKGDASGLARIIKAVRDSKEQAKVSTLDQQRAKDKEKQDRLLASGKGDLGRRGAPSTGDMDDPAAEKAFSGILATLSNGNGR